MKRNKGNNKKYPQMYLLMVLLNLFVLLISIPENVYGRTSASILDNEGQKKPVAENNVGFTIEAVKPSNQVDPNKGFFYVKMSPGDEQELTLNIKSTKKEATTVKVYVKDAYTTPDGSIDYDNENYKKDLTLTNSLEEITSISEKKITVQNFETKQVTIKVTTPKQFFEGVKVAAVCVMAIDEKEDGEEKSISSSFGYRIGLLVTEEDLESYNDCQSLNFLKVKPSVSHGKRVIQATFQNPEAKVLEDLTIKTTLRKKDASQILRSRETTSMRMAPNSQFDFSTNWGVDRITPGTYTLTIDATSKNKKWHWTRSFTIGEKEAKRINKEAVYTITHPSWLPLVVVLLGALIIVNSGFLIMRNRRWERQCK